MSMMIGTPRCTPSTTQVKAGSQRNGNALNKAEQALAEMCGSHSAIINAKREIKVLQLQGYPTESLDELINQHEVKLKQLEKDNPHLIHQANKHRDTHQAQSLFSGQDQSPYLFDILSPAPAPESRSLFSVVETMRNIFSKLQAGFFTKPTK